MRSIASATSVSPPLRSAAIRDSSSRTTPAMLDPAIASSMTARRMARSSSARSTSSGGPQVEGGTEPPIDMRHSSIRPPRFVGSVRSEWNSTPTVRGSSNCRRKSVDTAIPVALVRARIRPAVLMASPTG